MKNRYRSLYTVHDARGVWLGSAFLTRSGAKIYAFTEDKRWPEDAPHTVHRYVLADTPKPKKAPAICGAFSPGDPNDEDDPPVKCTERKGHLGDHAGGTRCGTITWKPKPKKKGRK